MDFSCYDPKDILIDDPEIVSRYRRDINILHEHLVALHKMIFILERIFAFPFQVFCPDPRGKTYPIFFDVLLDNFLLAAIVRIHRLARDYKYSYTLEKFKEWVVASIQEEHKEEFEDYIAEPEHNFDKNSEILKRIEKARHNWAAHFNIKATPKVEELSFSLEDLRGALAMLEPLIQALSFNTYRLMLPVEYSPEVENFPGVPDIERILDSIAKESSVLNMPENQPFYWKAWRETHSKETLAIINDYRRKFGLPEA